MEMPPGRPLESSRVTPGDLSQHFLLLLAAGRRVNCPFNTPIQPAVCYHHLTKWLAMSTMALEWGPPPPPSPPPSLASFTPLRLSFSANFLSLFLSFFSSSFFAVSFVFICPVFTRNNNNNNNNRDFSAVGTDCRHSSLGRPTIS